MIRVAVAVVLVAVVAVVGWPAAYATDGEVVTIEVLSNRADLVSGGDALIRVDVPDGVDVTTVELRAGDRDVTSVLVPQSTRHAVGLVDDLDVGRQVLEARLPDGRGARLTVTNHPIGGPVFAGPQVQPWVCATLEQGLGPPIDEQCNAPTKVSYLYQPESEEPGTYEPYDPQNPPDDVAMTTTDEGRTVPYVLRFEEGTLDRTIYHLLVLADPDMEWSATAPQEAWNRKLWVPFSGGCGTMHRQWDPDPYFGLSEGSPSEGQIRQHEMLSRGWMTGATGMNTLNYNCNEVVSAEALMMMKEVVIENYGPILRTISVGNSGGAVQQHNIAAAYPGILDGIAPSQSFVDLWNLLWDAQDCYLQYKYFTTISPHLWTDVEDQLAAAGKGGLLSCGQFVALIADPFDPQNRGAFQNGAAVRFGCEISPTETYHPVTNPDGARCAVQDYQRSIWGHGGPLDAAPLLFDNTGVQYGLLALQDGRISAEQFVDMNARIGALDNEGNPTAERAAIDDATATTMYRAGRTTDARQLANVPIIDIRRVIDPSQPEESTDLHQPYHTFVTRARLEAANGTHANQVHWRFPPQDLDFPASFALDRWLQAIDDDTSDLSQADKVLRNRPGDVVDTCWINGEPVLDSACEEELPHGADARIVAGAPLANDVRKCHLAPLDRSGYDVTFTDAQWSLMEATFPTGVCDWSRPSVGAQPSVPWTSYADGPGGTPLGAAPVSVPFGPDAPASQMPGDGAPGSPTPAPQAGDHASGTGLPTTGAGATFGIALALAGVLARRRRP